MRRLVLRVVRRVLRRVRRRVVRRTRRLVLLRLVYRGELDLVGLIVPPDCACGLIRPPCGDTGVVLCFPSELRSSKPDPLLSLITPAFRSAFFCLNAALFAAFAACVALTDFTTDIALGIFATVPAASAVLIGLFDTASRTFFTVAFFTFATFLPPVNGALSTPATFFSRSICPALLKNLFLNTATN